MATRDHTVRIRSSVPPDDTLTPPPRVPSSTSVAWPETSRHRIGGADPHAPASRQRAVPPRTGAWIPRQSAAMAAFRGRDGQPGHGHSLPAAVQPPAR